MLSDLAQMGLVAPEMLCLVNTFMHGASVYLLVPLLTRTSDEKSALMKGLAQFGSISFSVFVLHPLVVALLFTKSSTVTTRTGDLVITRRLIEERGDASRSLIVEVLLIFGGIFGASWCWHHVVEVPLASLVTHLIPTLLRQSRGRRPKGD